MRKNINFAECTLIFGIFMLITFLIFLVLGVGPYINIVHSEFTSSEGWTSSFWIPIWVIFLYMGSGALFVGFMLKIPSVIKNPIQQLNILICAGLFFVSINMYFQYLSACSLFISNFNNGLSMVPSIFGPIVFGYAMVVSIAYIFIYLKGEPLPSKMIY